ncbi:MAG: ATP-binding protein [Flavipsychrobacter sp.]
MQQERKKQIADALQKYCEQAGSQNRAANTLKNVSAATITQVLGSNWDNISDGMWNRIAKQIGAYDDWTFCADTHTARRFGFYYNDAQHHATVHAIIEREGGGKSESAKRYCEENANGWRIKCAEYMNRKTFLATILQTMGKDASGSAFEMMEAILAYINELDEPLLVFDEMDKLSDPVFRFFITFYNELEGKSGIVMLGTDHLRKRIEKGMRLNKMGYKEFFSRIGRRFVTINLTDAEKAADAADIVRANGITNDIDVTRIVNGCDLDIRRLKKLVHATKQQEK